MSYQITHIAVVITGRPDATTFYGVSILNVDGKWFWFCSCSVRSVPPFQCEHIKLLFLDMSIDRDEAEANWSVVYCVRTSSDTY